MSDTSAELSAFFDQQEITDENYNHLADLALENFNTRERFQSLVVDYREKVERGEGEALKLALALMILGRFQEALDWCEKTPDGKLRRFYAARANMALGRYDQALEELDQAAAKGWERLSVDLLRAQVLLRQSRIDEGAKVIEKHSSAGQDRAAWHFANGLLQESREEREAALDSYSKALTLDPEHEQAMFRSAWLYDLYGDEDAAIALYEELALQPRAHVNALINLAVIYEDRGNYDEALRCLQRVLKAYPNHGRARLFAKDVESCKEMVLEEPGDLRTSRENRMLDLPISEFELSVRARNCLRKMNIRTLGDIVKYTEPELLGFKNFGETSLHEIKAMLAKRGLRLGQASENLPGAPAAEAPAAPKVVVPPGREAILNKPVSELELSVRARRCLQRLNVATLGELCQMSEAELLSARNFGVTSLNEVKARLGDHGLQLAAKRPE